VHLVGFITKKFVTMHGHMNVRYGMSSKEDCMNIHCGEKLKFPFYFRLWT